MGLFDDGVSLKGVIRDVTNVVGAFTGARPIQRGGTTMSTIPTNQGRPQESGDFFSRFMEYLPPGS